jgi:hypothetical protein
VVSFTLVNADTDQDIRTLTNGDTLNLATLPTRNLNIRANTNPATVGSVRFDYDGATYRIENTVPYALNGDTSGNYTPWTPTLSQHTLTAIPYSTDIGTGTAGTSLTINFTVVDAITCAGSGITREVWTKIKGTDLKDLLNRTSNFSVTPDLTNTLTSFEAPTNFADNYGQRVRGFLCVPQSGAYTFWIASDNASALLLNASTRLTSLSGANLSTLAVGATQLASLSGKTNPRTWNTNTSQRSAAITLQPGYYYIEARMKQGGGDDNLAVAWRRDNSTTPANGDGSFIVPQANLYPAR